ncbi:MULTISPECIES: hypothetical protein [unclassified Helicobacter]|nr:MULTISPECIES: hypothetical protein [unclassified Helicobacter]
MRYFVVMLLFGMRFGRYLPSASKIQTESKTAQNLKPRLYHKAQKF